MTPNDKPNADIQFTDLTQGNLVIHADHANSSAVCQFCHSPQCTGCGLPSDKPSATPSYEELKRLRDICERCQNDKAWHVPERQEFDQYAYDHAISLIERERREKEKLLAALTGLVRINEEHNAAIEAAIGKQVGWKDSYLDDARAALKTT